MFSSIRKLLFSASVFVAGCLSVYGIYWLVIPKTVLQKLKYEDHIPLLTQTGEDNDEWKKKIKSLKLDTGKSGKLINKEFKTILDNLTTPQNNEIEKWKQECRNLYNTWLGEAGADQKYEWAKIACARDIETNTE